MAHTGMVYRTMASTFVTLMPMGHIGWGSVQNLFGRATNKKSEESVCLWSYSTWNSTINNYRTASFFSCCIAYKWIFISARMYRVERCEIQVAKSGWKRGNKRKMLQVLDNNSSIDMWLRRRQQPTTQMFWVMFVQKLLGDSYFKLPENFIRTSTFPIFQAAWKLYPKLNFPLTLSDFPKFF